MGFMWFGTQDGLNKYDGYEITTYKNIEGDSTSLSYNDVSVIFEDNEQNLWIGTQGRGLNIYDREKDTFTRYNENNADPLKVINGEGIFWAITDSEGKIWVATNNGFSVRDRAGEPFHFYVHIPEDPNSIIDNNVNYLFEDSRSNIWIGTVNGLSRYNRETDSFTNFSFTESDPESITSNYIYSIFEDKEGSVWIGTEGGGLNKYSYETNSFKSYQHDPDDPESIADNTVLSILEDSKGVLWIGTENEGLDVFDRENDQFYHYRYDNKNPKSLNNNAVYSLYESNDGTIWIGTFAGGLNIYNANEYRFELYSNSSNSSGLIGNNSILSFLEDADGNFWVGTDGGNGGGLHLLDIESNEVKDYKHNPANKNTPPSNVILEMLEDESGNIWLGTYQGGVSSFNFQSNEFRNYKDFKSAELGLVNNDVFSLFMDSEHNIWAGTNGGGIYKLGPDRERFVYVKNHIDSLGHKADHIRAITETPDGYLWFGTYGNGVARMDPKTGEFSYFNSFNSTLNDLVIYILFVDSKERLWIGTKGGGLNLYHPEDESFTNYTTRDGFPNDVINGILEDDHGMLWLSSNNGLTKFDPEMETLENFGIEDGLQSREFNLGAAYKDRDGFMYFGGINGFNRFHPDSIKPSNRSYPVILTDFMIFNETVPIDKNGPLKKHINVADEIVLPHTASVLSFTYAALNFQERKGTKYAYMLEGFDEDWNYVNEQRSATYTNLDPGEYIFKVKVANTDQIWSPDEASVALVITPPFWQTTWFYLISGLLVIGAVFGIYQWRVQAITIQNRKLEEQVRERTNQLREKNEDLEKTMDDLRKTRGELVENAHKAGMADIAAGVLHNVGNILNSVNTSSAMITDTMKNSRLKMLKEANKMLRENFENIEEFITKDPKGKKLLEYYLRLEEPLEDEHKSVTDHSERLYEKIVLINDVISAQQSYASSGASNSTVDLPQIIRDTFTLYSSSIDRHGIVLEEDFEEVSLVSAQKTKLIHVLVNLIKNAKEAMTEKDMAERKLTLKLREDDESVILEFSDTGYGVSKENLGKLFNQGFTTKEHGHGFGLHSSANYMQEMGGTIKAHSKGKGMGTTFILTFQKADSANS